MEATNNPNQPEGCYSVDYRDCINFSGEQFPETASINFEETDEPKAGDLCIYRLEGMNKFGLAHLSGRTEEGVTFEFTEGAKKRKGGFTPTDKVKSLHKIKSTSVDYK